MYLISETGKVLSFLTVEAFLAQSLYHNTIQKTDYGYKVIQTFSFTVSNAGFADMEVFLHNGFELHYKLKN